MPYGPKAWPYGIGSTTSQEKGNHAVSDDVNDWLFGSGAKSFPFESVGDVCTGEITAMTTRQQTSIDDGKPLYWDNGDPRMMLVITLQTDAQEGEDDDGLRSLYVRGGNYTVASGSGSSMATAVRDAVRKSGAKRIETGASLTVKYTGTGKATRGGMNAPKLYTATYRPPTQSVDVDDLL